MEHRHIHPITGAKGGWHSEDMKHSLASKHEGKIETRETGKEGTKVATTQESDPVNLSAKYALKRVEMSK